MSTTQHCRVLATVLALACAMPASAQMPSFEQVRNRHRASDALLLDRHGEPLADLRFDRQVRRLDWVTLDGYSPALREALLAGEDKRFFEHQGVDWKAVLGAAWHNLWHDTKRGASTLTMQLAGLLDPALAVPARPGARRDVGQKWDQGLAAQELEAQWTKPQILEAYLNLAPLRGDLQGVHAGGAVLFGKPPQALDRAEALLLMALLPSPNARAERVAQRACARARVLAAGSLCPRIQTLAPLLDTPRNRPRFSLAPHLARVALRAAGEQVTTTLDAPLQRAALDAMREGLAGPGRTTGGVVVLDNGEGTVRAWVGGLDPAGPDAVTQPTAWTDGLLPWAGALALEQRGIHPATLLPVARDDGEPGWRSLRSALTQPEAGVLPPLLDLVGEAGLPERLRLLGLEPPGEALPPGSLMVSALHWAQALRPFAVGGQWQPARWVGEAGPSRRVWRAETAWLTGELFSDSPTRGPAAFGPLGAETQGYAIWSYVGAQAGVAAAVGERHTIVVVAYGDDALPAAGRSLRALLGRAALRESAWPRPPATLVRTLVAFDPPVELPRKEWFLRGQEIQWSLGLLPPSTLAPRILTPAATDTLITLAPGDTVLLSANGAARGARWMRAGRVIGEGQRLRLLPGPGPQRIELRGPADALWDVREFEVAITPASTDEADTGP